jgi:FdhD protein
VNVFIGDSVVFDPSRLSRHVFASSSCGLCGKTSIESVHRHFAPIRNGIVVDRALLSGLPATMREQQAAFAKTGGVHAAALFDSEGKLVLLREDVGRHNAVDKVIGAGLLRNRLPFDSHILLVSGRASFEIVQKALAAQIPIICSVSAPSSLAVDFARESGQTLVGFLRDGGMNLYAGAERVRC